MAVLTVNVFLLTLWLYSQAQIISSDSASERCAQFHHL
jgi:hypothetical protein